MSGYFEGLSAVVTGAASGIGRQLARDFFREGASLILVDRDAAGLDALAKELAAPARLSLHVCDVGSKPALERFAAELAGRRVDILVNNAGRALLGPYERARLEDVEALLDVNLLAPLRLSRALLPRLLESRRGFIVNIASMAGLVPSAGLAAYAASKHGIVGFSEALGVELQGRVGVCAVCPSLIRTGIVANALGPGDAKLDALAGAAMARLGASPEKVSRAVLRAIRKDRRLILVNMDAAFLYYLHRLSPGLSRWLSVRIYRGVWERSMAGILMADPFFEGYKQEDVDIRGFRAKAPLFYRAVNLMSGVFTADLEALRRALPRELGRRPMAVWPGRGLAAIACFEYKDTDIGPYNEVALSIPILAGQRAFPAGEMLRAMLGSEFHGYIKELPVTTDVALYGGLDFFNYPKYLADIAFTETETTRTCVLREKDTGKLILEFTGQKLATRSAAGPDLATANTYPIFQGRRVRARLLMNRQEAASALFAPTVSLRLGDSPRAGSFKELKLGRMLQYVYAPRNQAILFKPQ